MEIASRKTFTLHKKKWSISLYVDRIGGIISNEKFEWDRNAMFYDGIDSINFFDSIVGLFSQIKFPWLSHFWWLESCDYASTAYSCKNCYLSFNLSNSENVLYSISVKENAHNIINALVVYDNSENIYNSSYISSSFNIFYSRFVVNSNNIRCSTNLVWCTECILCNELENSRYMFKNKQYNKDEYLQLKNIFLQSQEFVLSFVDGKNYASSNVQWQNIIESESITNGLGVVWVSQGRNLFMVGSNLHNKNIFDTGFAGAGWCLDLYGWIDIAKSENIYNSVGVLDSSEIYYSYYVQSCSFCLGCIWLKNKSYCILNKQYTKEERHAKVDEIFTQMDKNGTLGDFFPASMNPFYFNDTAAYLIDSSFTKEEVTTKGYLRRDEPIKVDIPAGADVVKVSELGEYEWRKDRSSWAKRSMPAAGRDLSNYKDSSVASLSQNDEKKRHIDPSILKKIIVDDGGNYYRIVQMEYDFLVKHGLPLPRKHRLDRMKENFSIN